MKRIFSLVQKMFSPGKDKQAIVDLLEDRLLQNQEVVNWLEAIEKAERARPAGDQEHIK